LVLTDNKAAQQQLTNQIRDELVAQNKLGQKTHTINILQGKNLSDIHQNQIQNYSVGDVIKFNRNSAKFDKDIYYRVDALDSKNDILKLRDKHNQIYDLPINRYQNRQVWRAHQLELRTGEMMQWNRGHYQNQVKRNEGQRFTILNFQDNGQIKIKTQGKTQTIDPEQLFFSNYRYADTLDNCQGRGSNNCFYTPSDDTSLHQKQEHLVSANSIARDNLTVYTDDARSLGFSLDQDLHLDTIMENESQSFQLNPPTRQQEWNLLLVSKHLVEQHGELQPGLKGVKVYRTPDCLEITRTNDELCISDDGAQLVFDSHNATVKNTFSSSQCDRLHASMNNLIDHYELGLSQSHDLSIDF
jgi:hypothetical protein